MLWRRTLLAGIAAAGLVTPALSDIRFYKPPRGALTVTTAGPVAITGVTGSTFMASLRIPAGSMGPNGVCEVECLLSFTANANSKQVTINHSAAPTGGGGVFNSLTVTGSQASGSTLFIIRNNNSAAAQIAMATPPITAPFVALGAGAPMTGTLNTAVDTYVNIYCNPAVATDTITLQYAHLTIYNSSLTPTTTGQQSATGTTAEVNLAALRLPGAAMGQNGSVIVKSLWTNTQVSGVQSFRLRHNTTPGAITGGTNYAGLGTGTTVMVQGFQQFRNNNAYNAQVGGGSGMHAPFGAYTVAPINGAIDTSVDSWLNLNVQPGSVGDTLTLVHAYAAVQKA